MSKESLGKNFPPAITSAACRGSGSPTSPKSSGGRHIPRAHVIAVAVPVRDHQGKCSAASSASTAWKPSNTGSSRRTWAAAATCSLGPDGPRGPASASRSSGPQLSRICLRAGVPAGPRGPIAGGQAVEYVDPLSGKAMIATVAPLSLTGSRWLVVAQQPIREAWAPIRRLQWQLGIATAIFAVMAVTVVVVLGRIRQQLRRQGRGGEGQPCQERLPGQHEP